MRKRLVSILMALCMAVSLLPVQALAADDAYTVGEDTRAKVRLYSGSLVPEENCATLTLADGTVTVYIHTEERLPVVLADTSGKYVGGDLTIYQDVSKPLTIHKAAKSITVADGKRVSELIIAGDANVTITGGRYSKVTVETGGVLQLRGGAVDSLIIKSEGHVSVMDSIVNSVTREDGAHFLGTADREVTTAQGLAAALADSEVSKVILTADVQLTGSRLDVSRYVPVDLNGHVLRSNGSNIVFWVGNGGYLELNDSDPESTHSDFSVKGGIITGGKVPAMGSAFAGGVVVNAGGRFTMNGGTIMGCSSPFYGARDAGGVYVYNGGIFTMKGGTIRDCSAGGLLGAGGVYNEGTMYADGGTIRDCGGSAGVVNEGTIDASYNAERTVFLTSVSSGGTIKASAKCQVTFLTMYGSTDGTRRVLRGQAVSRPADPTSEGHELLGWRLNGADVYDFSAPVMGDLILMAWWGRSLSGSGTAEEPYQIGNAEELVVFRDIVNGANGRKLNSDACAVLTADIVLNDGTFDENGRYTRGESGMWLSEWTPMGQYERTSTAPEGYGGTFDGQGHTIKGLYVSTNAENTHASGLFAQLTGSAVVQNVTVTGYIYVHGVGGGNVGGIAGEANGAAIRNCRNLCDILLNKVDGSTSGVQINAGGIAGSSSGTIENCRNDGTLRTIAPNADCTTAVVCAVCGDTVTAAKSGHTWGAWTSDGNDRHTRRCTVNGCRQSETARCSGGTATCVERAVCAACGAAYGAVDSKNHTALVKVNGRPATPTQVGYVTCWTCEDCGRYFRDAAGTQEIRKEDASIGKAEAAGASGSVRSARTADEGAVGLWIAAASGAAMALAGAAIRRRRHAK